MNSYVDKRPANAVLDFVFSHYIHLHHTSPYRPSSTTQTVLPIIMSTEERSRIKRRRRRFTIPTTSLQFQTCLRRLSLKSLNCLFYMADRAMYILGPILITLAAIIIVGLTYVYFYIVLPMMSGTNWIVTVDDYHAYWNNGGHHQQQQSDTNKNTTLVADTDKISTLQSILLALATITGIFHTTIVTFFLINIIYNY